VRSAAWSGATYAPDHGTPVLRSLFWLAWLGVVGRRDVDRGHQRGSERHQGERENDQSLHNCYLHSPLETLPLAGWIPAHTKVGVDRTDPF